MFCMRTVRGIRLMRICLWGIVEFVHASVAKKRVDRAIAARPGYEVVIDQDVVILVVEDYDQLSL